MFKNRGIRITPHAVFGRGDRRPVPNRVVGWSEVFKTVLMFALAFVLTMLIVSAVRADTIVIVNPPVPYYGKSLPPAYEAAPLTCHRTIQHVKVPAEGGGFKVITVTRC